MKILVVGGGGREHALAWAIAASPLTDALLVAPGNPGMADIAELVPISAEDVDRLVEFAVAEAVDLVVIGPEAPLVAGLADRLRSAGISAFGPSAAAAELEGSKGFMKDFCQRHKIPTARYARFTDLDGARAYVKQEGAPIVVKADGLAAGKGVTVAMTVEEALAAVDAAMAGGAFGAAGDEVVIEEFLSGEELSYFALTDGESVLPLASAQDHKAAYDGDTGPNTGGMGAYSPAPVCTEALEQRILSEIIEPTIAGLAAEGRPYQGVLFAGLMIGEDGAPRLIEFNCRFGDPECQVLMMRLMSDILPALVAAAEGDLDAFDLRWYAETALTVVMASKGYPGSYEKGTEIKGVESLAGEEDLVVFHAGTGRDELGRLVATGGRVIAVTALGGDIAAAQARAYAAIDRIDWPGGFCRRDIGWRAIARLSQ